MTDPTDCFDVLGVSSEASEEDVRRAWRTKAKTHHPDVRGGDSESMRALNSALAEAIRRIHSLGSGPEPVVIADAHRDPRRWRDVPSFVIEALPVDAFETLVVVASTIGTIIDEDPPYLLEFTLESSGAIDGRDAWCRCEVFPSAGSSMIHLTVGGPATLDDVSVTVVRDELVHAINEVSR